MEVGTWDTLIKLGSRNKKKEPPKPIKHYIKTEFNFCNKCKLKTKNTDVQYKLISDTNKLLITSKCENCRQNKLFYSKN